jgi:hypothetical protein
MDFSEGEIGSFGRFVLILFRASDGNPSVCVRVFLPIGFADSAKLCFLFALQNLCFPSLIKKRCILLLREF